MPTKKELSDLLSDIPPRPPLRRGRGLRLSAAPAHEQNALASAAPEALVAQPQPAEELPAPIQLDAPAAGPLPTTAGQPQPAREKRKLQLRKDLLKASKRIARQQDRKLYQVIESAIEEYVERYGDGG